MNKIYSLFAMGGCLILCHLSFAQEKSFKYIDRTNMNLSVKPGDDFVEYSNGIWTKNNPIPPKETRWGSFNEIRDFNIKAVKLILEETVAKQATLAKGSVKRRVADFTWRRWIV